MTSLRFRILLCATACLAGIGRAEDRPPSPDNRELVEKIRELIVKTSTETEAAQMKPWTGKIPRTGVAYDMVVIPGGEFLMGSPETEPGRKSDEGPQVKVAVDPFWMGACEVTWDEYKPFMLTPQPRYKDGAIKGEPVRNSIVDAVSGPTSPYTDMTFGLGEEGFPAISMTQHSALKYCQWLSAQTGHFYRLPTEAEWEYAARAGSTGAWFWGNDESRLPEYAWTYEDGDAGTHPVRQKKPNPWGLYDIYGNVMEWTLDQYAPEWYFLLVGDAVVRNPFHKPVTRYPRSVRGGSADDDGIDCRSARRRRSTRDWKAQDAQLPKSLWYHTNAQFLGFRLVRPLKIPSAREMEEIWNQGVIGKDE